MDLVSLVDKAIGMAHVGAAVVMDCPACRTCAAMVSLSELYNNGGRCEACVEETVYAFKKRV